jgi:hypothetical protein
MSATDFPNAFRLEKLQSDFHCIAVIQRAWSRGGGEHEFTAIVKRACASCGRDLIATLYRLRVVIASPRIEIRRFPCTARPLESCVPDAAQASHVDCGIPAAPIHGCGLSLDDSQCGPDDPTWPSDLPTFDQLIFSGSVSQLQKKPLHTPACDLLRKRGSCGRESFGRRLHLVWC